MALTPQQKLFVELYMSNGYKATPAYQEAFKCTERSANSNAYRIFKNPEVKAEIEQRQKEKFDSLNITANRLAEELADMAFADKGDKDYPANVKLKAIDLLQSQLGLKKNKINLDADVDTHVTIVEDI